MSSAKAFLIASLLLLMFFWCGCAASNVYTGPASWRPIVSVQEWRVWNTSDEPRHPFWETQKTVVIENPFYYRNVSFDIDCENATYHIDVKAREIGRVRVYPQDGACDIKRVPDRTL